MEMAFQMVSSTFGDPRRKQGRGIAWTHEEVLSLIALWGEEKVQRELHANHRNHHVYAAIVAQLQEKGINRTVSECRNKCKTLKSDYQKVQNHNKISGNAPTTCPYFSEIDKFLNTDRTVFPKRVSKSLHITRRPKGSTQMQNISQPPESSQQVPSTLTSVTVEAAPQALKEEDSIILEVEVPEPCMLDPVPQEEHVPQDFPDSPASSDETQIPAEAGQDDPSPGPASMGYASQQSLANESQHGAVDRGGPVRRGGRLALEDNEVFPERRARRGELIALTLMEDSRREGRLNRKLVRRLHNNMLRKMEKESAVLEKLANSYMEDIQNTERHRRRMMESMDALMDLAQEMLQEQRQRNNYQPPQML